MKKILFIFFLLLALSGTVYAQQWYVFHGAIPSGDSLWFLFQEGTTDAYVYGGNPYTNQGIEGDVIIPSTVISNYNVVYNVVGLYFQAFYNCTGITSVTIPNSVTSIGQEAFSGCSGLTSVTIPNSVTSIGGSAFSGCSGLTSVTIPNSVTSIGGSAFYDCSSLTSVTIGNSVTSIGNKAFVGCSSLASISVDSENIVYDSRNNCNAIIETSSNKLIIGCQNTTIPNSVTSIGYMAFAYCNGLTSVTIPNSVTSIGTGAFAYCSGLTSVTIPNSVTSIDEGAFYSCSDLTSVTIPNSVTSIGDYAFHNCSGLTSVTIGSSVTSIGFGAFHNCSGLTEIHSLAQIAPSLELTPLEMAPYFGYTPFDGVSSTIPVYVPCGRSSHYYVQWSYFSNIIEEAAFTFSAESADDNMGVVQILTMPTCTNPNAVLYAVANNGYRFDHWSTGSTSNPYTLTVTTDTIITAYFVSDGPQMFTITVEANDAAMGSVTGGGEYAEGSTATLTAIPNNGYTFALWLDGNIDNPRIVTVTGNATYTAVFQPNNSVTDINVNNINIYTHDGRIMVDGAEGMAVVVYDALGRMVSTPQSPHNSTPVSGEQQVRIAVPMSGVYLVKVGDYPARRVMVIQ